MLSYFIEEERSTTPYTSLTRIWLYLLSSYSCLAYQFLLDKIPEQIISVACPVVLSHYPFVDDNLIHTLNIIVEQLLVMYPEMHRFWASFISFYIVFGWCNQRCVVADSQWCKLKLVSPSGRTPEKGNSAKSTYCNLGVKSYGVQLLPAGTWGCKLYYLY